MRSGLLIVSTLVVGSLVASPALAHKKAKQPAVSCKEIKDAMAAGKTADDVAKDLKTTAKRVKTCTAPAPAKHHSHQPKG
jgi:hypothetical protein